ncbi:rhodanese-like domain-containing protein [Pseudorhodoferax sp. Leaf267]|uniref:rhodanese-like domain-containing protein n=1 Tax=Pseudorhodoferax sp. Leaf267 TaxID=1736316 RepID=UPI0006FED31C|nr:rhodanese-like domain-containing protein [Pseudorhodoferax sp. Leaf267]KQP13614.1 sulfurtransferase [Pseudorhodoferax sp. Leaf267]
MPQTSPISCTPVPATTLRQWLNDGHEIALLDVREAGQFGEGHPFFAVPAPYSRLELDVPHLVPRRATRTVLLDAGDGVAARAAQRLAALGYTDLHVLDGGAPGWAAAGYTLFQGVNLPSKTFGELVEHAYATPHISAAELQARQASGQPLVLLDGRTFAEHRKVTIPGATSVPNGELALRWHALAPDPATPIVIHCAGRTRSIIGAQILRSLGVPNPVVALENGTQGWALAGLPLEHGSTRRAHSAPQACAQDQAAAARLADEADVQRLDAAQAQAWLDDAARTVHVLDVRSDEEFAAGTLAGARHAPGGQLLQATDQTIGVRNGRVLLLDGEAVRAPVVAAWLARLGYETAVVEGGIRASLRVPAANLLHDATPARIDTQALPAWVAARQPLLLDLQDSRAHRRQHAQGARWTIRSRLPADAHAAGSTDNTVLLLASDAGIARLAVAELAEAGWHDVHWALAADWVAAGLPVAASPDTPADADAIDYLLFVHDRHDGNLEAARRYLAWETGLIAQCAPDELAVFRLPQPAPAAHGSRRA